MTVNDVAPSGLGYSNSSAVYTKGRAIAANTPTNSGGPAVSYATNPALPAGLSLDAATGVITGTPTVLAPQASYTITAINSGGSTTAALLLTVTDVAPSGLTYAAQPMRCTINQACSNAPGGNGGGAITSYSIAPVLPSGLSLNASTGVISGTSTALFGPSTFVVTGTNSVGSTTVQFGILVVDVPPGNLAYDTPTAVYTNGKMITANSPTSSGGAVVSYAVSPALPAGLSLDSSTGAITGTPTAVTAQATYTVTATNSSGSTIASISITVTVSFAWANWHVPAQPPSNYTSGSGAVTDNVTGLVWQQPAASLTYTWPAAITYCQGLSLGGVSAGGWRLPTRIELLSIVDSTKSNPAINQAFFPNTSANLFWSSSPYVYSAGLAWVVNFYDGSSYYTDTSNSHSVRCVH